MYNDDYLSVDEILHKLLGMSQIIVCFCSIVLIQNFCFLGEMSHFSYVAFDRMNKQRVQKKEAQWRRKREYQIAGDEDKNDATIEDYHWCILKCDFYFIIV